MQKSKAYVALTDLLPSFSKLLALARQTSFVQRACRKIFPDAMLRAVLMAVCQAIPHFRNLAANLSAISEHDPSRQAVFERLKSEAAPAFFYAALCQVISDQCRRLAAANPGLRDALKLVSDSGVFGRIIVEDGTVVPLHDSLAEEFEGSINQHGSYASLRQRWAFDYFTGETLGAELHLWKENDMSTAFDILDHLLATDLVLRDMGYFCLECLHQIAAKGAYFLTRLPEGTVIGESLGGRFDLYVELGKRGGKVREWQVEVGADNPVPGRVVAVRIDACTAAERKRRLRKSLLKQGKQPTRRQLLMCEWVVVFTNALAELIDAEAVAQLYRARWMVEIFFKGMKSGQNLESWSRHRTNANTIQCLSYAHMIVGILSLNLWRLMGRMVNGAAPSGNSNDNGGPGAQPQITWKTVGPLKALELLIPLLESLFARRLRGRALSVEFQRISHYAVQEKRKRLSLDALVIGLLT
jgi:IS4 transposase